MDRPRRVGPYVAIGIGVVLFAAAIALLIVAWATLPTDDHHGEAIDGLDGIAKFFALLEGGGALVLMAIGVAVLRRGLAARARPAPPPLAGTELPAPHAAEAPPAPR